MKKPELEHLRRTFPWKLVANPKYPEVEGSGMEDLVEAILARRDPMYQQAVFVDMSCYPKGNHGGWVVASVVGCGLVQWSNPMTKSEIGRSLERLLVKYVDLPVSEFLKDIKK